MNHIKTLLHELSELRAAKEVIRLNKEAAIDMATPAEVISITGT